MHPLPHFEHGVVSFGTSVSAARGLASKQCGEGGSLAILAVSTSLRSVATIFASDIGNGTRPSIMICLFFRTKPSAIFLAFRARLGSAKVPTDGQIQPAPTL